LPLAATRVGLSLTDIIAKPGQPALEILELFRRAILGAERLIYVETQYFTSRLIAEALCRRFSDAQRGKLACILVMPDGADTPKEDLVLGARQRAVRYRVAQVAAQHGHEFRLLKSRARQAASGQPATFIHSKLLIVDDELVSIGSANLTNRSMSLDTELNLSCSTSLESGSGADRLRADIARLRADLLAEHAGLADVEQFTAIEHLIERLDAACRDPAGKLHCQELAEPERGNELLTALFDPACPLDWESVEQSLEGARSWLG
jgi:phospholipase D1/2